MGCLDDSAISDLLEGRLPEAERQAAQEHLDRCEDCRAVFVTAASSVPEEEDVGIPAEPENEPAPAWPGELPPGAKVGRYQILERAGVGGMGEVYAAYDPELDRKVALKMLHPADAGRSEIGEVRRLLAREAKTAARLSHPNVVSVFDVGTMGDRLFIAMELVEGGTLAQWLRAQERPWGEVLRVFLEAGRGLAAAHAAGIVHRDFKPANVLLGNDGQARVTDFGLARLVAPEPTPEPPAAPDGGSEASGERTLRTQWGRTTRTGMLVGTPAYMAPEQLRGRSANARSDLFSYCVALYEALYRKHPFAGRTVEALRESVLQGRVEEPPEGSRVPKWVRRALLRGLQPDPHERFASMDALLAVLSRDPVRRRRRWLGAAAAAMAVAAMFALLVLRPNTEPPKCRAASGRLAGTWDTARRQAIARAFRATGKPFAQDAWRGVERALSRYGHRWVEAHRDACEATWVRGEQSQAMLDLRMGCLERRLQALRATTDLLVEADAGVVRRSVRVARSLPPLASCGARASFVAVPPPTRTQVPEVTELRKRLIRAGVLRQAGRYRAALPIAVAVVTRARKLGYRPLLAEALLGLGQVQRSLAQRKEAEKALRSAQLTAQASRHDRVAAAALVALTGVVGALRARAKRGREWSAQAAAAIERIGGDPRLESELENNLGRIAYLQEELPQALARFRRAAEIARQRGGQDNPRLATILTSIGGVLQRQGKNAQAVKVLERALAIARRAYGSNHPVIARRLAALGLVLGSQYRFHKAIPYLEQALAIEERVHGAHSGALWSTLNLLGGQLLYQGNLPRSQAVLERALIAVEKLHGKQDLRVAQVASTLGQVLLQRGSYPEALTRLRRGVAIMRRGLGPTSIGLTYGHIGIGMVRLGQGRIADALREYRKALRLREKKLGAAHPEVATALHHVGDALLRQGKYSAALAAYERSRVIRKKALGPTQPDFAESLMGVAEVHLARGDARRALPLLERALTIFAKRPGDPQAVARTRFVAARALWLTGGDRPRARRLAAKARTVYARIPHYARALARVRAWQSRHR